MASCLSCHFITKTPVYASLPNNSNVNNNKNISNSPSLQSTSNPDPPIPNTKPKPTLPRKRSRHQNSKFQQNLTLIRIERAVGAGSYRDNEPKGSEQRNSILKGLLPNSDGALEGSVENKLRETGEWVTKKTERGFQSNASVSISAHPFPIAITTPALMASASASASVTFKRHRNLLHPLLVLQYSSPLPPLQPSLFPDYDAS